MTAAAPMPASTLTALEGSIAKWEAIVDGTDADRRTSNCPLCRLFLNKEDENGGCSGCPVRDAANCDGCGNTPYVDWATHHRNAQHVMDVLSVECDECQRLAQAELDFLKSLLPTAKTEG